jgi:hypothetical protein
VLSMPEVASGLEDAVEDVDARLVHACLRVWRR